MKSHLLLLTVLFIFNYSAGICQPYPSTDDEFVGPFASWINVKTQFGAVGDGIADETASLQAALDAIGTANSVSSVVFLPAGTYRITGTLQLNNKIGVSIIGADPSTTKIIWGGALGGTMLSMNGIAYSRFNRITWDGTNSAGMAIDQAWTASAAYFDTGNEFADNVFTDVGYGIRGGRFGHGFAEIAIMRCKFIRNSFAGVSVENFNALDVWVWNSLFQDCARGVTNLNVAGNFKVYNCVFRNSTISDLSIGNNGEFSFRNNTSVNSKKFLTTTFKRYPYNITLQANTIIDPISDTVIDLLMQGPVIMLDNIIRSRVGAVGPVVYDSCPPSAEFIAIGNTFTVNSPIKSLVRNMLFGNTVVARSTLSSLAEQILPGISPNYNRQVIEVPVGSNAATIQAAINQAAALNGNRPVVHLPKGNYSISTTLNIPSGTDLQLVGDGHGEANSTFLLWAGTGEGPVIKINGPSKATVRDLYIHGNQLATNILVENIDQPGSRVFMHEFEDHANANNLIVDGLDHTRVLAYNSRFSWCPGKSISIIGGPMAADGNPQEGRTILYGGLEWDNGLSHEITKGGNLLVRDVWYESGNNNPYLKMEERGKFIVEGSHIASTRNTAIPVITLNGFDGSAVFLNIKFDDRIATLGNGSNMKVMGLGVVTNNTSVPVLGESYTYMRDTTSPPGDVRSFNSRAYNNPNLVVPRSGSYALNNTGTMDSAFIISMLSDTRNVHAEVLNALPAGVSDVRFYRVWSYKGYKGLELKAGFRFLKGLSTTISKCGTATISLDDALKIFYPGNGTTLTWSVLTQPLNGTITGLPFNTTSTGSTLATSGVNYSPANTSNSPDTFRVQVSDGTTIKILKVIVKKEEGSWLGTVSANWNDAANWCNGVPTDSTDVKISANATHMPLINSGIISVRNISIDLSATISIGGGTITIHGAVSGQGSFSGSASAKMIITGNAGLLRFTPNNQTLHSLILKPNATATLGTRLQLSNSSTPGTVTLEAGATLHLPAGIQ